jgi:hypothetical protein
VELATLEWVDWFNYRRFLEPVGNVPPVEAESGFYRAVESRPIAASASSQPASGKPGTVQLRANIFRQRTWFWNRVSVRLKWVC